VSANSNAQVSADVDPIELLNTQFKVVQKHADDFHKTEKRHLAEYDTKLSTALVELYAFGSRLMGDITDYQEDQTLLFFKAHDMKMNVAKRRNPFIALMEMAFAKDSASTRSQRAKVLGYARHQQKKPAEFQAMLASEGGIKGIHEQAAQFFESATKKNNDAQKVARLKRGRDHLGQVPSLADFEISDVPDGFAVFLARVDGGKASVVHVLQHEMLECEKLDATVASFDPDGTAKRQVLGGLPLGRLWRGVDLVMSLTEHMGDQLRHVGIRNLTVDGKTVNELVSLSSARNEAIARVRLSEQFVVLPDEEWRLLYSGVQKADADLFRDSFGEYENWRINGLTIEADQLLTPLAFHPLPDIPTFRIEAELAPTKKDMTLSRDGMRNLLAFIEEQRKGRKPKAGQAVRHSLPELMSIAKDGDELRLSFKGAASFSRRNTYAAVGTTDYEPPKRKRELAHTMMTRVARAMLDFDFDVTGSFLDHDTPDACLRLNGDLGGDLLTLTIPTRESEVRNLFTQDLKAA